MSATCQQPVSNFFKQSPKFELGSNHDHTDPGILPGNGDADSERVFRCRLPFRAVGAHTGSSRGHFATLLMEVWRR